MSGRPINRTLRESDTGMDPFVFQSYHLLDDLTVAENLEVPLSYRNVPRSKRQALVADTFDRVQIVGKKDLYPSQLSGGAAATGRRGPGPDCKSEGDPGR